MPNGLASTSKTTTLALPWTTTNICSSPSIKFPKKSLTITIYKTLPTKAKSTWKFAAVCMAFPKPGSSLKNNLSVSLEATAIPLFPTHPDYGTTNGDPSPSTLSSTILASNTLAKNMPTTSSNASATITKNSKSTGLANASVAST